MLRTGPCALVRSEAYTRRSAATDFPALELEFMLRTFRRIAPFALALSCALAALAQSVVKPKIVVAIVIDQFRYDYLLRFRGDYHAGLDRLLSHGAVFTDAHYPQATTVTAVGHSTFLTGAPPAFSGIINNEWYDRESGGTVSSVSDPRTFLVGATGAHPGSSPRRLLVSTVGDELKMSGSDSKVIGVSIKDRSAILPAGHMADGAYWFDPGSEAWVTSTYYRETLPAWAKRINDEQPAHRYAAANWLPVDAKPGTAPFCTMAAGTSRPPLSVARSLALRQRDDRRVRRGRPRRREPRPPPRHRYPGRQLLLQRLRRPRRRPRRPRGPRHFPPHRSPDRQTARQSATAGGHRQHAGGADRRPRRGPGARGERSPPHARRPPQRPGNARQNQRSPFVQIRRRASGFSTAPR